MRRLAGRGKIDRIVPCRHTAGEGQDGLHSGGKLGDDDAEPVGVAFEIFAVPPSARNSFESVFWKGVGAASAAGSQTRVGPEGSRISTRVFTSNVRQPADSASSLESGDARLAEAHARGPKKIATVHGYFTLLYLYLRPAEDADIAQIAIFLGEIEPVADHEFVRNLKAHIRHVDRAHSALRLIQ